MDVSPELPVDKHGTCPRCGAALGEPYDRKEYDEGETPDGDIAQKIAAAKEAAVQAAESNIVTKLMERPVAPLQPDARKPNRAGRRHPEKD